jgi:hypothetical protein
MGLCNEASEANDPGMATLYGKWLDRFGDRPANNGGDSARRGGGSEIETGDSERCHVSLFVKESRFRVRRALGCVS